MVDKYLNRISKHDENKLIDAALSGNSAAYAKLVTANRDRLLNVAIGLMGCPHEAEDVVQDAFIDAYKGLASFHRNSSFYTWLYRIASNIAFTRRRQHYRRNVASSRLPAEKIDHRDGPCQTMMRKEIVRQVQSVVACLPEKYRDVIVQRELNGNDYQAISEILSLHIGTVRSRIHRARERLRNELLQSSAESLCSPQD